MHSCDSIAGHATCRLVTPAAMSTISSLIVFTDAAPRRRNQTAANNRIATERADPDASQPERASRPILGRRMNEADTVGTGAFDELVKFPEGLVSTNVAVAKIGISSGRAV